MLAPLLRARVAAIDPMLPVESLATGEERVALQLAAERFNTLLLAMFAGVGLVLAGTGIYGMMALYVAHRRHELGVRLALGASPAAVRRLVLDQMAGLTAAGIAAGIGGALLITRFMTSLLYEVSPTDLPTLGWVALVIAAVSFLATAVPVRRALRIEPAAALRME